MRAYSQDLRERVVQALESRDGTQVEIAERFGVSVAFVERLWQRWRTTGSCAALPHAGGPPRSLLASAAVIRAAVAAEPDMTLAALCEQVVRAGGACSESEDDVCGAPATAPPTEKKSLHATERDTPRVKRLRRAFRRRIAPIARSRLKFLDEAGINLAFTPRYGRAAPGERVVDRVPRNYGPNVSVLAALDLTGLSAPMTVDGAVDTEVFQTYVERVLAPTLHPGDVVVMDNLSVHKGAAITEVIQARGARVEYLAPYSPDDNPIEQAWSKLKTALRYAKARTRETLDAALRTALPTITSNDAHAWFTHAGYT